jgi:plastocyanin
MKIPTALLLALAATGVHAASHRIDVGRGGLTFTPDTVTAAVGDTVDFYFVGGTHDAVTSEYATPCSPRASGERFSSGVQTGSANNVRPLPLPLLLLRPACICVKMGTKQRH